ncbi:FG-GAP-like repeat-containing protein [Verrucomicrobia bacterium]|nr:FG-GAP-like repeat-containing protein [Verrucomicrobiota bacterium]
MKPAFLLATALATSIFTQALADSSPWEFRRLHSTFYSEDASFGDVDGDGIGDMVYGPHWFPGPDFNKKHAFYAPVEFSFNSYSDNFFSHVVDINKDGKNDVVVFGFPGKEARLYLNPGDVRKDMEWPEHIIASEVGCESPTLIDLIPGGSPEIACSKGKAFGYYQAGKDATKPWTWYAVSEEGVTPGRFGHGFGVGDLNGDGRMDLVDRMSWWEQPAKIGNGLWTQHRWVAAPYPGGAQILINDMDGDGDADIVSSLVAHGYGLAWFEQIKPGAFIRHDIMGEHSTDNPYGTCFSQIHALAMADMDGDGLQDFVTGKRWKAHNGHDTGSHQPAVLYWFQCKRTKDGIDWVPHEIHDNSGVGVDIHVADLNNDGRLDVISGNKMGLAIHIQKKGITTNVEEKWKIPGGRPQDKYGSGLTAEQAAKAMEAPEGFEVDLITSEPGLVQPIAMTFDARGRIWVVEGLTYPERSPEGEGKDRILILEDADGNGTFESRKIFIENLNLASAIEVGFGGVWVGAAPYLLFIPDKDQDDIPDSKPQILLDGWGYQDTHETLNSFTWGPDGWLYGCHGVFTHSKVGKLGTPDSERVPFNAGIWRYHPTLHHFEAFAQGTSNPWGVDFNEKGDLFISSCVIPHFFHMVQGGRYIRQGGQHFNEFTYGEIDTIADHSHYAGSIREHAFWGPNKAARPAAPSDTSALGGGHAHCGLAIYQAEEFPSTFQSQALFHNLHGHRIIREELEPNGSGYIARHRPDFVMANNHDYIGVGIMQGPDGAVYYSDWVDPQTCHHRDPNIWDRTNGRIYRVRYGDAKPYKFNLWKETNQQLVDRLASPNSFFARQAQRILQERSTNAKARKQIKASLNRFITQNKKDPSLALRGFWTINSCDLNNEEELASALSSDDVHTRSWALQFLGEDEKALSSDTLTAIEKLAATDTSLVTRRYLASLLQRLPFEQRWTIAENLINHQVSDSDINIPLLTWYGIEPLIEEDAVRAIAMVNKSKWKDLKEYTFRRACLVTEGRSVLMTTLAKAKTADDYIRNSNQLLSALGNLPPVQQPDGWKAARKRGTVLTKTPKGKAVQVVLDQLGVRFGDSDFFPHWRRIAKSETAPPKIRNQAMGLLYAGNDPQLTSIARGFIDDQAMQRSVITALRKEPGITTANLLIPRLAKFPAKLRTDAINLLAARADMALALLKAVNSKTVSSSLISPVLLDQFERFGNKEISKIIAANWTRGGGGVDMTQLTRTIKEWKGKLTPRVMGKASVNRGRQTFKMICANCHKLFGDGIDLGPDLTGSNRADLGYILENVLAPSSVVGNDYKISEYTMKDDTVISGMIREKSSTHVTIAMPGGTTASVKLTDVFEHRMLSISLMPAGVFEALPIGQVADLVKYLASSTQVPLPGQGKPKTAPQVIPASSVPAPAKGTIRFEAESFATSAKLTGGRARSQSMNGFGTIWSGNKQLWWTDCKPGDRMELDLKDIPAGSYSLTLYTTSAADYGVLTATVDGHAQSTDLYSVNVQPGDPLTFHKVTVKPDGKLDLMIEITGTNPKAKPSFMVGLDRIELKRN